MLLSGTIVRGRWPLNHRLLVQRCIFFAARFPNCFACFPIHRRQGHSLLDQHPHHIRRDLDQSPAGRAQTIFPSAHHHPRSVLTRRRSFRLSAFAFGRGHSTVIARVKRECQAMKNVGNFKRNAARKRRTIGKSSRAFV